MGSQELCKYDNVCVVRDILRKDHCSFHYSQGCEARSTFDKINFDGEPKTGLERFMDKYPDYENQFIGNKSDGEAGA